MKGDRYIKGRLYEPFENVSSEEVSASVSLVRLSLARGGQIASPVSSDVLKSYVIFP